MSTILMAPRGSDGGGSFFEKLPADMVAKVMSFLWSNSICRTACTCILVRDIIMSPHVDALLFRHEMMCKYPSVILSAMESSQPVGQNAWRSLLRCCQLTRVEWVASKPSDQKALKEPSKSRSLYAIRIEAGLKRYIRIGGHYFFKVAFREISKHVLDSETEIVSADKWQTPRIRGSLCPSPLRGFSFKSIPWDLDDASRSLAHPAAILFGGAETAYPFDEQNQLWVLLAIRHSVDKQRSNTSGNGGTSWFWIKPRDVGGTHPSPRRGASGSYCRSQNCIVYYGGSRTSPCCNYSDVHILSLPSHHERSESFHHMSKCLGSVSTISEGKRNAFEPHLSGFSWSKVLYPSDTIPPPRFAHMTLQYENRHSENTDHILIYGGSQLGGKTSLIDVYKLSVRKVEPSEDTPDSKLTFECTWTIPHVTGDKPDPSITGPATVVIGRKMLLIGGHAKSGKSGSVVTTSTSGDAEQQVARNEGAAEEKTSEVERKPKHEDRLRVLAFDPGPAFAEVPTPPQWHEVYAEGDSPAARIGVGLTVKGAALLMSGGYEKDGAQLRARLLNKSDSWRLQFIS